MFQSLQGTIPTYVFPARRRAERFVSIPSRYDPNPVAPTLPCVALCSFNPFKVRSQLRITSHCSGILSNVSIPSRYDPNENFKKTQIRTKLIVSIPSRYDPNNAAVCSASAIWKVSIPSRYDPNIRPSSATHAQRPPVSIPSRYDPNVLDRAPAKGARKVFQSLQGTIPTYQAKKPKKTNQLCFNPFKVRSQPIQES